MLAVLAPGQGAQTPGFLAPWLDRPGATERLRWWSSVTGIDLLEAGTGADADAIRDTAVTQPLLVAAALLSAEAVCAETAPDALAGHSVGEYAAAALAGVVTEETALSLVTRRAAAMAAASAAAPTGMAAVLGGDAEQVLTRLAELELTPANRNGAGQIVAAGSLHALEELRANPPDPARVRPLAVAGAFHTDWMASAREDVARVAAGINPADPHVPLLSNADGALPRSGVEVLDRLVAQMTAPVRFDLCLDTLRELGVTGVVELLPGGTLAGIVRRELPAVEVVAVRSPEDLPAARATVARHAAGPSAIAGSGTLAEPGWRLVVSPTSGTFQGAGVRPGDRVGAGDPLGQVVGRRTTSPVAAPVDAVVTEWLVADGDPVSPARPLARLHPAGERGVVIA